MTIKRILIKTGRVEMPAELNESKTASLIWDILPVEAEVNTWGKEIFSHTGESGAGPEKDLRKNEVNY
ncbi:MAG: cyclophilin-like family protein [Candidatus Euphemobacter frigidus]|nr:cyclophilin-like family protein [Candidatus Euphemobacter frigidus]